MSINSKIQDGTGSGNFLKLESDGSANVTVQGLPPDNVDYFLKPFSKLLADENGSTDMRVDGSVTYRDFQIFSSSEGDRYVGTLAFTISDAGSTLSEFGNLAALINGCELIFTDNQLGDVVIATGLRSNFDFIQLCNFEPTFGNAANAFLASNVTGTSEAYVPILDLEDVFGLPYGLKLRKESTVGITLRVNDNVTGVDRFDVRAFGFDKVLL